MKNDYLWDKVGEDAEIEELEKTLQVFRYQESAAPLLPIKVAEVKPKFSLFSLRFTLSFASCIALLLGGFFGLSQVMNKTNLAETAINQNSLERPQIEIKLPKIEIVKTLPNPQTALKPINIGFRQKEFPAPFIRKLKTKKSAPKVQLTKEEQYAYDQLMLALSITGSKLKQVQDKVNGGDEITATVKTFK